ncbi:esterase-like activity of phytase family protein [Neptunicella marina]|uniref:Esterase-like activity of phytase family protein n=1 Tax=Neptunicella marina TaxID=2125989 RepID=A0A8J6IT24_9ALTE|nr:esterase-like activity of phytase family protein [Neptunicella marina]MBC3765071.1 esterase-like activity of phytase family protein [Neptunicella marina]
MRFKTQGLAIALVVSSLLTGCSLDGDDGKDGANGNNGSNGSNGLNSLIRHQSLATGSTDCFFGGTKIESGLDSDGNGTLEDSEVTATTLDCHANTVSTSGSTLPYTVLRGDIDDGAEPGRKFEIRNGGYGSDMVKHPTHTNQFYALTDRGPNANYTGDQGKGKLFPTPDYTPRIGLFELQANGDVKQIREILLKDTNGNAISGLPNSSALGGTGETPYAILADGSVEVLREDMNAPYDETTNPIKLDDFGLDGEGLVALSDGTFWVSDEYGPHIVHFDADGKEIGRINAFANDTRDVFHLPAEFAYRRANRGMEGLTVTPDEKTLVGIMQSTMYLPDSSVKNLDIVRIVTVSLEDGAVSQYLYKQQKPQNSQSGIVALSATEFVLIERDGAFFAQNPDAMKHLYKIDISNATDLETFAVSGDWQQDAQLGLTKNGQTLEQLVLNQGWEGLTNAGIMPVEKTFVADLVAEVAYPHDKLEGLWLINDHTIGVLNDDDFATWSTGGVLEQKYLDAGHSKVDANTLYIIDGLELTPEQ